MNAFHAEILTRLVVQGGKHSTSSASGRMVNTKPAYQALRKLQRDGYVGSEAPFYNRYWFATDFGIALVDQWALHPIPNSNDEAAA